MKLDRSYASSIDVTEIESFILSRRSNLQSKAPLLSSSQELELVNHIKSRGETATPLYSFSLCETARSLFNLPSAPSDRWRRDFLRRHPDITSRKERRLTRQRAVALNPVTVSTHFTSLASLFSSLNLTDDRIFNLDEKGFNGDGGESSRRILCSVEQRNSNSVRTIGFAEHVSVLACVSARGTALPPIICFEGESLSPEHINSSWTDIRVTTQSNGYFTAATLLSVIKHIDSHTSTMKSASLPLLLILDGSSTHLDPEALSFAVDHHMHIYRLPPNTTHRLQPLDRSCFRPFSSSYKKACVQLRLKNNLTSISKKHVLSLLEVAWKKAFKRSTIVAEFESTGIYPLNPSAITSDDLLPSAPLLLPSSMNERTPSPSPLSEEERAALLLSTPLPPLPHPTNDITTRLLNCISGLASKLKEARKEIVRFQRESKRKTFPKVTLEAGEVITTSEFITKLQRMQEEKKERKKKQLANQRKKRKKCDSSEKDKENTDPNLSSSQPSSLIISSSNPILHASTEKEG